MSYYDRIRELTKNIPTELVDFTQPRDPARTPTQASSNFITNKEQGDWAENLITRAINETAKNYVAVKYGKSDDLVAGEEGFDAFYQEFQNELDTIGKRPDLLIFKKSDFINNLGYDISHIPHNRITEYVKKAIAGIEVRSSAFLIDRYEEAMQIRAKKFAKIASENHFKYSKRFLMIVSNAIEQDYSKQISLEHRKKFAQFFTPLSIAEIMVQWLLGNENLKTVLEPAFGLGIFSRVLLSQKTDIQIKGFEVDTTIFEKSQTHFSNAENINLLLEDYMYNDWQNKYDGIICNPPYFKFHDYDNKNILKEIEKHLQCSLSGFTNLYTLFLLKSIYQLAPNGRCAYIIPSEFLNSDYGKLVKQHLIKTGTLRHIIVFDFEENVFDDALTTACIILCANDGKTDKVQFNNIQIINQLKTVEKIISDYPDISEKLNVYSFSELNPEIKWKAYYQSQNGHKYKNLVPFSTYAKVVRGIATGANDYFTFNLSKAKEYKINEQYLLPCICHCVDIKGNNFTYSNFEELKNKDKNVFLLNAVNAEDDNITQYLRKGENEKINKRYLTASRNPWYSLEKRPPAPIWVSVFNRTGLRFIRNEANISNLTTLHCIYPNQSPLFSEISIDLLFAYLLTDTARQIFEDNSREYGNGLQKFEPNDINKGKMLDLALLPENSKNKIVNLYYQFKDLECDYMSRQVIDEINNVIIENYI